MELTQLLIDQVYSIAGKFGNGNGQGDDMVQECFAKLWELPESKRPQALTISENLCRDILRVEGAKTRTGQSTRMKLRLSTSDDNFVESVVDGKIIDVEKYIEHIPDPRLRAIVDRCVDKKPMSSKDRCYLFKHRELLDRDFEKYLKPMSPWMIFVLCCEPYSRLPKRDHIKPPIRDSIKRILASLPTESKADFGKPFLLRKTYEENYETVD